ncbi:hypothetical protein PISMIDRAFT_20252 [Pisolithus microcarpus 441]|uniref:Uncharacterized protein n=1 Tax=Pisolithus microcarpus 441 TaxID=765257 RepID=A0A0C9YRE9_9AGAM|nr:hypothetical protein PISMIDRAFT_20252 [Pisolithus microcarpus 441]
MRLSRDRHVSAFPLSRDIGFCSHHGSAHVLGSIFGLMTLVELSSLAAPVGCSS